MRSLLLLFCATFAAAQYDGHKLIQLHPTTAEQSRFLRDLMINEVDLDFWTEPSRLGGPVDVLVPPHMMERLNNRVSTMSINYKVLDENIQESVDKERLLLSKRSRNFDLNGWNDFDTIDSWTRSLPSQCGSGLSCETYSIGTTAQGRPLTVLKMSTGSASRSIWLDSAIHAREWLAPATLVNVMNRMVTGYGSDSEVNSILNNFDVYFLPVMNPDGYQYTFGPQRLWRKNRANNPGSTCLGTDLNRNYDYMWGREGVSTNPCSDIFAGSSGASELETRAVQNEAARISNGLVAWITIHSYGYMWMHPWGNTVNNAGWQCERASDHNEMYAVADATANAIERVYNTRWARGTSCEVIYETTGATDDYMKARVGVKHPICPELRGNGFIVDSSQIALSYNEFWAGLVTMCGLI